MRSGTITALENILALAMSTLSWYRRLATLETEGVRLSWPAVFSWRGGAVADTHPRVLGGMRGLGTAPPRVCGAQRGRSRDRSTPHRVPAATLSCLVSGHSPLPSGHPSCLPLQTHVPAWHSGPRSESANSIPPRPCLHLSGAPGDPTTNSTPGPPASDLVPTPAPPHLSLHPNTGLQTAHGLPRVPKRQGSPPHPASPLAVSRPRNPPGRPPPRVPHAHHIRLNPCDLCGPSVCRLPPPGRGSVRSGHVCLGPRSASRVRRTARTQ